MAAAPAMACAAGAQLAFHLQPGNYDTDSLIEVLGELRRFLGGEKATLLWDGLPAHRSRAMQAWLNTQRHWLVVERLPAYAPELNPVEGLWSWLKGSQLANLVCSSPPGRGRAGRAGHPARMANAAPCLFVSSPDGPLGLMTRQTNTQNP